MLKYNSLELDASFVIHGEIARNILNGNGFSINQDYASTVLNTWRSRHQLVDFEDIPPPERETLQPEFLDEPGYSMLLAATWKLFGSKRWIYVRILQVLLDCVMVYLVYLIGRRAWNERTGLIAAGLYAVFIPQIELAVRPHRDAWVTFAYIVSVYILLKMLENEHRKKDLQAVVGLALILAATAWMRSTIVAYVGVCALAFFLLRPFRKALLLSAVLISLFFVILSPLALRNYELFGRLMITRGAVWHSFWAGVGQFPNPYGMKENDEYIAQYFEERHPGIRYGRPEYEEALKGEAMKFLRDHPVWYAGTILKRALVILAPKIGRALFFQPSSDKPTTGLLNAGFQEWVLMIIDGLFFVGMLGGVWLSRRKGKMILPVALPLLYTLATLSPFYVVGRNIMNAYFVTLLFSSVTTFWVLEHRRALFSSERQDA